MNTEEFERGFLWNSLVNLGGFTKLRFKIDPYITEKQLHQFNNNWCKYNEIKDPDNNRWGLALTSKSGDINDNKHLNSFSYLKLTHGLVLSESDFTTPTAAYHGLPEIAKIVDNFSPDIGRVHLLRIDRGGFWPFHRDYQGAVPEYFRLLLFFGNVYPTTFCSIFNNNIVNFEKGSLYFANTQLEHSVFSMIDNVYCLVLTVKLNQRTHDLILQNLETY